MWVVHKFGGTSLGKSQSFKIIANTLKKDLQSDSNNSSRQLAVVVSALGKTTDWIIDALDEAKSGTQGFNDILGRVFTFYVDIARELIRAEPLKRFESVLKSDLQDIDNVMRTTQLAHNYTEQVLELVTGYGELWSAQLMSAYLNEIGLSALWMDARAVLTIKNSDLGPQVQWGLTQERLQNWSRQNPSSENCDVLVITGYIASTTEQIPTSLKRNGSDFTASIVGKLFSAESINIWTDVDGVMSANPQQVPEAVVLEQLSYHEAIELAYFGAKVIHPSTIGPAVEMGIPVRIRNTHNPNHPGTQISAHPSSSRQPVKGFSTVDEVALINVEGTGMMGVPGIAKRVFSALSEKHVSVILISQASSEHSICLAVPLNQGELAQKTLQDDFFAEIEHGQIQKIETITPCSILAAVGSDMVEQPGVAGQFLGALGKAGVNIRAIAQGSSERNISVVVDKAESIRALRAVHGSFYLSDQAISLALVGPGLIGQSLLKQIWEQADYLKKHFNVDLIVRAICNSKKMIMDQRIRSFDPKDFEGAEPTNFQKLTNHIRAENIPHCAIVDCSASDIVAQEYPKWLAQGVHVVTPNKKAGSGSMELYKKIQANRDRSHCHFFYEATVGAGLPVVSTLRELINTGDQIYSIEGIFSGTLSYIFNSLTEDSSFSSIVKLAKEKGFTEPEPRDDLSGMDVARKLIILARETGLELELDDLQIDSLVPEKLRDPKISTAEFLERLPDFDKDIKRRDEEARAQGKVLRYVGKLQLQERRNDQAAKTSVALEAYPIDHPFAHVQGSDNIILFRTMRYDEQPLVIRGPGAGPEVTAGGVFGDLLKLAHHLGAKS